MSSGERGGEHEGDGRLAFHACFDAHYSRLLAFVVRRVDGRATAEDVLADTFAVAWRRRDAIPDPALPWLYGIARGVIANQRRGERRRSRLSARLFGERNATARDPAEVLGERDTILRALGALSEGQREVLRLAAWEGLDTEAGAAALGCTPSAYRVRLHRARRELEKQLAAGGHSSTQAATGTARDRAAGEMR